MDLLGDAKDRLPELDAQVVAQVRTCLDAAASARSSGRSAKERVEDVPERTKPAAAEAAEATGARTIHPRVAEHVVGLPALPI